jgi:hypothetical protein
MDCTGQPLSIVFLHTPSCVQIFIARGILVMIKFPFGDLNGGSIMVPIFGRVPSPCDLTNKSSKVQQNLMGSKLLLPDCSVI